MAKTKKTPAPAVAEQPALVQLPTLRSDGDGEKPFLVLLWGEGDSYTPVQHDAPHDLTVVFQGKGYAHVDQTVEGVWVYRRDAK